MGGESGEGKVLAKRHEVQLPRLYVNAPSHVCQNLTNVQPTAVSGPVGCQTKSSCRLTLERRYSKHFR
eukprot:6183957-Pleurochrysis_carterae.AAC.5